MRRAPIVLIAAVFLLTAACNATDAGGTGGDGGTTADAGSAGGGSGGGGGQSDGGSGGGTIGNCVDGQTRCNGNTYESCQNQSWTTVTQCTAPQVCVAKLSGCAACNPLHPTTCQGNNVASCNADGTIGNVTQTCASNEVCQNGACVSSSGGGGSNCATGTQLIYVVDDANDLLSFDPQHNNTLTKIGTLSCSAGMSWPGYGIGMATPFSMSVDRSGYAWVLYSSGQIFKVPITNPSSCTNSGFTPGASGYQLMGMGFVATAPGAQTEHLYIAGGQAGRSNASGNVGYIDPATLQVTTVGTFTAQTYGPELTGTGDAKLYAYFPDTTNTRVAELDPATGAEMQSWKLPALSGQVNAWAFAHWGGRFYIFVTVGGNSQILMLDPTNNGAVTTIAQNLQYTIVGAGVSTCAPVSPPPP